MTTQNIQTMRDLKILARDETKGFQWPTLALSVFLIFMTLMGSWLAATGIIPLWLAMISNSFWIAQGYTVAHECAHRNLHGHHQKFRWLNDVFGIASFFFTLHSYTVHCHVHRLHHAHTNDRTRDTDAWVSDAPNLPMGIFRSLAFYFHTNFFVFKIFHLVHDKKRFVIRAAIETAIPVGAALVLAAIGYWREVLMLWALPTIFSFAIVSFAIDWIPHHVEDKSDEIKATMIIKPPETLGGKVFSALYNNHNYHLVHHLVPSVPWYAQKRIFDKAELLLNQSGARITKLN